MFRFKAIIVLEIVLVLVFGYLGLMINAETPYIQAIHVLDPDIEDFKYYASWNSDQWIQWVRQRYVQDFEARRPNKDGQRSTDVPMYGVWVNIILISTAEDIKSAFSQSSNRTYPDDSTRSDYFWSNVPFSSYVVVRKVEKSETPDGDGSEVADKQSQYNVHNCSGKKMFINAKVDPVSFNPMLIQTLFPKKVKNPKNKLRIPLVVCSKVSQVRGLLDEIRFQLGGTS